MTISNMITATGRHVTDGKECRLRARNHMFDAIVPHLRPGNAAPSGKPGTRLQYLEDHLNLL